MQLRPAELAVTAARSPTGPGREEFVAVVTGSHVAMYATLTTLAHGTFGSNAVLFKPPSMRIKFFPIISNLTHPTLDGAFQMFKESLRVEDVSLYRVSRQ